METRRDRRAGGSGIKVRPAQADDQDLLVRYVQAVALESEGETLDERTVATGVQAALADPEHRQYLILEKNQECVGCCLITTEWSDWTGTWYWWLQSIYVEQAHRGKDQGMLKALLDHVHTLAKAQGVKKVRLYVHKDNTRAVRAYEGQGYEATDYLIYEHGV